MRPTLPKRFLQEPRRFGMLLMPFVLAACTHKADPPVAPGPPLAAEPDLEVGSMDDECNGLVTALAAYRECPNLDDDDREWLRATIEVSEDSFTAGKKGNPDAQAQHTIALACRRAVISVRAATQRCLAGPKPKVD